MLRKIVCPIESLVTEITNMFSFVSMQLNMSRQILFVSELFIAFIASETLGECLSGMILILMAMVASWVQQA
jgi:hypothetical protein